MQKIFLAISISLFLIGSISYGATSNITIKIYEDYSLTNGTLVWVPLHYNYSEKRNSLNDSTAGSIELNITSRLNYHFIKQTLYSPDQYGIKADYRVEYSYEKGFGRPWSSPHGCCLCLPDVQFINLYEAKLRLISLKTNKVVAEVEYRRHRCGPNIGSYVYRMVDTLVSKGTDDVLRPGKYAQYFMGE